MIRAAALAAMAAGMLAAGGPAGAAPDFDLPAGAQPLFSREMALDSYDLPTGNFAAGGVPSDALEGRVIRRSWRMPSSAMTTLQLLAPLRRTLEAAGFEIVHSCADRDCGGFDFRFATEVIPPPDMHVDLSNYRFLAARHPGSGEAVSLLVSRNGATLYLQVVEVHPAGSAAPPPAGPEPQAATEGQPQGDLAARLLAQGHAVLEDLEFDTGAETLGPRGYDSLAALAGLLAARDDLRLVLVGHTDSVGDLDDNLELSRDRAEAVRERLIARHGVDPARIEARGVAFLAPAASNLTQAGRDANRRVEAVILPVP